VFTVQLFSGCTFFTQKGGFFYKKPPYALPKKDKLCYNKELRKQE